ncbi:MAG: amidohydrolase family protein [Planctomycetota bacterium]
MDQPPIDDAFVRMEEDRIVELGERRRLGTATKSWVDLGEVTLLPECVNAHTHLEFSDIENPIGRPGIPLFDWIGLVVSARGRVSDEARQHAIEIGLRESLDAGVGLIGDIATTPCEYSETLAGSVVSFAEVLGLTAERSQERMRSARRHAENLFANRFAISPHAPYSTPPELISSCVDLAVQRDCAVAMHVAESPAERLLLETGEGGFASALKSAGFWQDGLFPWQVEEPVHEIIRQLARAPRALLVHGNDLRADEIEALSKTSSVSVVYCPRTHDFFGYQLHPVGELLRAGVRVAIGTDSRASNPDLSVWNEVRFLLKHRQDLSPEKVLWMATRGGAEALLGKTTDRGCLRNGTPAHRILVLPSPGDRLEHHYSVWGEWESPCKFAEFRP